MRARMQRRLTFGLLAAIAGASLIAAVHSVNDIARRAAGVATGEQVSKPGLRFKVPAGLRSSLHSLLWPGAFEVLDERAEHVRFVAANGRYVADVASDQVVLVGPGMQRGRDPAGGPVPLSIALASARTGLVPEMEGELPGSLTYLGSAAGGGARSIRYSRARFRDVLPGIDVLHYASDSGLLEFDFVLAPGADPRAIRMEVRGATDVRVDADGSVVIEAPGLAFTLQRPKAHQFTASGERSIPIRYVVERDVVEFRVGSFDRSRTLIIDPLVVANSTFFGSGGGDDNIVGVATDPQGNVYVTGQTSFDPQLPSTDDFPTTPESYRTNVPLTPHECAYGCGFVVKLSPQYVLQYGALFAQSRPRAIAVDSSGRAHVTGRTFLADGYLATPGSFSNDPTGLAFVLRLAPDGASLEYAAVFVGVEGRAIAVDDQGATYVAGVVETPNLPTTPNAIKPQYQSLGDLINVDGFLLKVAPSGSALIYGTYLGGAGEDSVDGIAVDASGRAIVVGSSESTDFVGATGASGRSGDAYAMQVAADGSTIESVRWVGGENDDAALAVSTDHQGGWLVGGATMSADLPVTAGAYQSRLLGERNGWLLRLSDAFGVRFLTYFGGEYIDGITALTSDAEANAYFGGIGFSKTIPTTSDGFQDVTSLGDREAHFGVMDPTGSTLRYGTYLGGYYTEPRDFDALSATWGVARSIDGSIYVVGGTTAASFPTTGGGLREAMGGIADAYIVRLIDGPLHVTTASLLPSSHVGSTYRVQLAATGGDGAYRWSLSGFKLPEGLSLASNGEISGTLPANVAETSDYQFTVRVVDGAGRTAFKSMFIPVLYPGQLDCSGSTCSLDLQINQSFAYDLPGLSRGVPPYQYVVTGNVPPGVTIDQDGHMSGAATAAGTFTLQVEITDSVGASASLTMRFNVTDPNAPPAPPPPPGASGGGGGATDLPVLLMLLVGLAWVRRPYRGPRMSPLHPH